MLKKLGDSDESIYRYQKMTRLLKQLLLGFLVENRYTHPFHGRDKDVCLLLLVALVLICEHEDVVRSILFEHPPSYY